MNAEPSLQRRLTLSIVLLVGISLVALSLAVQSAFDRAVRHQFDARLRQDAAAVAHMVEEHERGPWEMEHGSLETFDQIHGPASFEIRMPDGTPIARMPPGAPAHPPPAPGAAPTYADLVLAGGRHARLYQAWLDPRQEEGTRRSGRQVAVAVTRDTENLLATTATMRRLLWGFTFGIVILAASAAVLAVRGALARVTRVSEDIASLDAASLGTRLQLGALPRELRAPFDKLNELLGRIEESFSRERQFTSDASHELRTPLAGLRSILEVAASRDRTGSQYRAALTEALSVVHQMEALVEELLSLARTRTGDLPVRRERVALAEMASSCFAPHAETARSRMLRFSNRIAPGLHLSCDPEKLRIVLCNLLSNAAEYTAEGGWIAVEADPASGVIAAVRNSGPAIPEHALEKIFGPFFRLDESRTGDRHFGIGLALVRALCDAQGYRVDARNDPGGEVVFTVREASGREPAVDEVRAEPPLLPTVEPGAARAR